MNSEFWDSIKNDSNVNFSPSCNHRSGSWMLWKYTVLDHYSGSPSGKEDNRAIHREWWNSNWDLK